MLVKLFVRVAVHRLLRDRNQNVSKFADGMINMRHSAVRYKKYDKKLNYQKKVSNDNAREIVEIDMKS